MDAGESGCVKLMGSRGCGQIVGCGGLVRWRKIVSPAAMLHAHTRMDDCAVLGKSCSISAR